MITPTSVAALITAVAVLLSATAAVIAAILTSRNGHRIMEVKLSLNSRLDELLESNRKLALMEGHIAGVAYEKAEQDDKNKTVRSVLQQRNKDDLHKK